jgi:hypothetical protein
MLFSESPNFCHAFPQILRPHYGSGFTTSGNSRYLTHEPLDFRLSNPLICYHVLSSRSTTEIEQRLWTSWLCTYTPCRFPKPRSVETPYDQPSRSSPRYDDLESFVSLRNESCPLTSLETSGNFLLEDFSATLPPELYLFDLFWSLWTLPSILSQNPDLCTPCNESSSTLNSSVDGFALLLTVLQQLLSLSLCVTKTTLFLLELLSSKLCHALLALAQWRETLETDSPFIVTHMFNHVKAFIDRRTRNNIELKTT